LKREKGVKPIYGVIHTDVLSIKNF